MTLFNEQQQPVPLSRVPLIHCLDDTHLTGKRGESRKEKSAKRTFNYLSSRHEWVQTEILSSSPDPRLPHLTHAGEVDCIGLNDNHVQVVSTRRRTSENRGRVRQPPPPTSRDSHRLQSDFRRVSSAPRSSSPCSVHITRSQVDGWSAPRAPRRCRHYSLGSRRAERPALARRCDLAGSTRPDNDQQAADVLYLSIHRLAHRSHIDRSSRREGGRAGRSVDSSGSREQGTWGEALICSQ